MKKKIWNFIIYQIHLNIYIKILSFNTLIYKSHSYQILNNYIYNNKKQNVAEKNLKFTLHQDKL